MDKSKDEDTMNTTQTTAVPETLPETDNPTRVFTLHDRCDQCGAAAKIQYLLSTGLTLMFCGHHSRNHHEKIMAGGAIAIAEAERAEQAVELED